MRERVLLVDDEPAILNLYSRGLEDRFVADTALGGERALQSIETNGPYAVVVTDLDMPPGIDGVQLATRVKEQAPDTVCLILTGRAVLDKAIRALNTGHIFRFMTKPLSLHDLGRHVEAGLVQYRLVRAERELLENTLGGCVGILADVMSMIDPNSFSSARRVKRYVDHIVSTLGLSDAWQFGLAALLSRLGCLSVPADLLTKAREREDLTEKEQRLLGTCPTVGAELLRSVPRFETVAAMTAHSEDARLDGPKDLREWDTSALGALILRAAEEIDRLVTMGHPAPEIASILRRDAGGWPESLLCAIECIDTTGDVVEVLSVKVDELRPSMVLVDDVRTKNDILLAVEGQEVSLALLRRLQGFALGVGVVEPLRVRSPSVEMEETTVG